MSSTREFTQESSPHIGPWGTPDRTRIGRFTASPQLFGPAGFPPRLYSVLHTVDQDGSEREAISGVQG